MGLIIANDRLRVGVSTQGGVLTHGETLDGRAFLRRRLSGQDPKGSACYPMLPLCNRLGGNGFSFQGRDYCLQPNSSDPLYLHGDGWLAEWSVVQQSKGDIRLEMRHNADGPFRYRASQEFSLQDNSLSLSLAITNAGDVPMPFGFGFHPFFPREGAETQFNAAAWWQEGAGHLPIDRQSPVPADVCFSNWRGLPETSQNNVYEGWDGRCAIRWPSKGLALDLQADPVFTELMLYAPQDDTSFFCLEPMTHLPNALNMAGQPGIQVLAPGETLSGTMTMTIHNTEIQP